jgi:hypothetical protein
MEFGKLIEMLSLDMDRLQALASGVPERQARWKPAPTHGRS